MKAHDDAVKKGFLTFLHRWFERPVFRRQLAEEGVGPFFATGVRGGELMTRSEFNPAWIKQNLSGHAQIEANIYLRLLNEWTNTSVQGDPAVPLGKRSEDFGENERHRMFINDSGLVPTHMPWIILSCMNWMERYPCQSNHGCLPRGRRRDRRVWQTIAGRANRYAFRIRNRRQRDRRDTSRRHMV
eukprot:5591911-Amphidinium_carterae.13